MKVAVLGGTGDMGFAVARRLAKTHTIIIGSRDSAKARKAAREIKGATGDSYEGASRTCEVAIVSIPFSAIDVVSGLSKALTGKLVISVINPIKNEDGLLRFALENGSAAGRISELLPKSSVATAFNNVPVAMMRGEHVLEADILVAASSKEAYGETAEIVRGVRNLRPLYAGPISEAQTVERITPLVVNLARMNGTDSLTTKFVSTEG